MNKIFFLILFPFILNAQSNSESIKKDSVKTKNVPPLGRSKEEAKQLIESLRLRVTNGEDMGTLANLYSEDPGSAKRNGQLSPFKRGQMVPEFEEVAFSLKPGDVSDIFETKYGFHFIQLLAKDGEVLVARHILLQVK